MTAIQVGPPGASNYNQNRNGTVIDRVVMHWTTASLDSTVAHFRSNTSGVSAHYIIDRDGLLYQMCDEAWVAYHAGDYPMNLRSIGIEHVGGPNYAGFTDDQYQVSADLIRELSERYGFAVNDTYIIRHSTVTPTQCPGVLDTPRIITTAQGDGMDADTKAYIDAKFTELYGVMQSVARRSMRGAEPWAAGNDTPIAQGEHIYPEHAK